MSDEENWSGPADLANLVADRDHYMRANVVLRAAVERVKALHQMTNSLLRCTHDDYRWPCPTIRALEQP